LWYWWFRDHPADKKGISAKELKIIGAPPPALHQPVRWGSVLRDANFQRLLLMYHTYCWGAYFYLSWLHPYLQTGRGLTEDQMRVAATMPSCAAMGGVLIGGFMSDRLLKAHSLRWARGSIGCIGLLGAGIAMLAATQARDNRIAVLLLSLGLGSMNLMLPVAWAICLDIAPKSAGAVTGAMNMTGQAGSFLSSVAFGYMVQWFGSYDLALIPLAACLIVSGLLFATIDPCKKLDGVEC
jgi:MFS transporter, ACS family, glucarate transporter